MKMRAKNHDDIMEIYNDNLELLLTGKRKLQFAKEVNNTLGKISNEKKNLLLYKTVIGDRADNVEWYSSSLDKSSRATIQAGKLNLLVHKTKK